MSIPQQRKSRGQERVNVIWSDFQGDRLKVRKLGKSLMNLPQEPHVEWGSAIPGVKAENDVFYSCHGSWFALYSWLQNCRFDVELDLRASEI